MIRANGPAAPGFSSAVRRSCGWAHTELMDLENAGLGLRAGRPSLSICREARVSRAFRRRRERELLCFEELSGPRARGPRTWGPLGEGGGDVGGVGGDALGQRGETRPGASKHSAGCPGSGGSMFGRKTRKNEHLFWAPSWETARALLGLQP